MLHFPNIDPIAFSVGPLPIRWYGLAYLSGFIVAIILAKRNSQRPWSPIQKSKVEDLIAYGVMGVVLGGRIGYVLFYSVDRWMADPLLILRIWEGGMSFHGGLIGVTAVIFLYSRANKIDFLSLGDFVAPLVPAGLFFGRIGNFINQELYGRITEVPWAMIFPADPTKTPRHPSQLYEALGEGILLFLILSWFARKPRLKGEVSGLFLLLYGTVRFLIEFVRQPDTQFRDAEATLEIFNWMTRGQWLCVPMMIGGLWLIRRTIWSGFEESADGSERQ